MRELGSADRPTVEDHKQDHIWVVPETRVPFRVLVKGAVLVW